MNDHVDGPDGRPTELVIEPTRLGGRRSTRRGLVTAVVATIFIGAAVWKPWDTRPAAPGASPGVAPASAPTASGDVAFGSPPPSGSGHVLPVDGEPFPTNAELLAATTRQPTWGVRAMVFRTGGPIFTGQPNLVERWVGVPANVGDVSPALSALAIAQPDDDVAAIGVTTLDDALALDVRFWSLPPNGPAQRLAAIAIQGPEAGSWLWLADPAHATDRGTWQAGAYGIDVLLGPRIVRLRATIPSASGTTTRVATPFGQPPFATILDSLEPGPFALADGGAEPLVGGSPPVVDEREAWLGPAAGLPPVAHVAARQVTGFGMLFAAGDEPVRVHVRQLAPLSSPIETGVNIVTVEPGHRRAVIAWPVSGGVVPDGLYHMTVSWTSAGADHSAESVIEVQPQVVARPPNAPLDAMTRWVGLIDRPDIAAREPLVFVDDTTTPDRCSVAPVISGSDPLFGVVAPPRVSVVGVRLRPSGVAEAADVPIRFAPDAIPRLTVVALPSAGLPVRAYDLIVTLGSAAGERDVTRRVCVSAP
ncbi:MAG TPA: hypothetical protein VHM48_02630 [Candidatus Limnocylindrales bacterium]|nr:hypothetical protein [Candidatus Limnocylindrales bacterium]